MATSFPWFEIIWNESAPMASVTFRINQAEARTSIFPLAAVLIDFDIFLAHLKAAAPDQPFDVPALYASYPNLCEALRKQIHQAIECV